MGEKLLLQKRMDRFSKKFQSIVAILGSFGPTNIFPPIQYIMHVVVTMSTSCIVSCFENYSESDTEKALLYLPSAFKTVISSRNEVNMSKDFLFSPDKKVLSETNSSYMKKRKRNSADSSNFMDTQVIPGNKPSSSTSSTRMKHSYIKPYSHEPWNCEVCTYRNEASSLKCLMCQTVKANKVVTTQSSTDFTESTDQKKVITIDDSDGEYINYENTTCTEQQQTWKNQIVEINNDDDDDDEIAIIQPVQSEDKMVIRYNSSCSWIFKDISNFLESHIYDHAYKDDLVLMGLDSSIFNEVSVDEFSDDDLESEIIQRPVTTKVSHYKIREFHVTGKRFGNVHKNMGKSRFWSNI